MNFKQLNEQIENILNKKSEHELLQNCIAYLSELKERDTDESWYYFWKNHIGMTDQDMQYWELDR